MQVDELPKQVDMSVNSTSLPKSACLGVLGIPGAHIKFKFFSLTQDRKLNDRNYLNE